MELDFMAIGQFLLYFLPLGLIMAWMGGWLYRTWRVANMPAILGKLSQSRRRDAVIKETRLRVDALEGWYTETGELFVETKQKLQDFESRTGTLEKRIVQLRQKLRSRGVLTDA